MADAPAPRSRRVKFFSLDYDDMLMFLRRASGADVKYIVMPRLDLPEGARVVDVHMDYRSQAFDLIVEHESFPELDPCTLPVGSTRVGWEWVRTELAQVIEERDQLKRQLAETLVFNAKDEKPHRARVAAGGKESK